MKPIPLSTYFLLFLLKLALHSPDRDALLIMSCSIVMFEFDLFHLFMQISGQKLYQDCFLVSIFEGVNICYRYGSYLV
jgi:hypothetical protein